METKKRFKMYKSGKKWLVAAIVAGGMATAGSELTLPHKLPKLNKFKKVQRLQRVRLLKRTVMLPTWLVQHRM